eukprot:m.52734 g.52734  ORF g.52734 m.52734 type:complete len:334 (+) comp6711_c1_seq1:270-1271(+)
MVGHTKQLAKIHATLTTVHVKILHEADGEIDRRLVVRGNHDAGILFPQNGLEYAIVIVVGVFNRLVDGIGLVELFGLLRLVLNVRAAHNLGRKLVSEAVGACHVGLDALKRVLEVALVRVEDQWPLLVVLGLQTERHVINQRLEVLMLSVNHQPHVKRCSRVGNLVEPLVHVLNQLKLVILHNVDNSLVLGVVAETKQRWQVHAARPVNVVHFVCAPVGRGGGERGDQDRASCCRVTARSPVCHCCCVLGARGWERNIHFVGQFGKEALEHFLGVATEMLVVGSEKLVARKKTAAVRVERGEEVVDADDGAGDVHEELGLREGRNLDGGKTGR